MEKTLPFLGRTATLFEGSRNQPFLGSPLPQTKPQFMVAFKLASTIGKNSLI
jgi:hypothetical protein